MENMMDHVENCFLDEYIRDSAPDESTRRQSWEIAIGLQDVADLTVSLYLMETAGEHIEGKIDITTAKLRIDSYHKIHGESTDTMESDMVSVRIAEILGEKAFSLRPQGLISIHERLFTSIYDNAGKFRNCNVIKHEIMASSLEHLFKDERSFSYDLPLQVVSRHIASFISGIWQIHPFAVGNTRTVAVFLIKYLQYLGLDINGDVFADDSRYFRNALVRANYQNQEKGISRTASFLELFFDNLLLGATHELKNRYMYVDHEVAENVCVGDVFPFEDFH